MDAALYRYIDLKVLQFFRESLEPNTVFSPSNVAERYSAIKTGWAHPLTALWRTKSPARIQRDYGRSVLYRSLIFNNKLYKVQVKEYVFNYNIFSASYMLDYCNSVGHFMINRVDDVRYMKMNMTDLIPDYYPIWEWVVPEPDGDAKVDEDKDIRSFINNIKLDISVTVPYINDTFYAEGLKIFLNDNLIYVREA